MTRVRLNENDNKPKAPGSHKFAPGNRANPRGRKPGSLNKTTKLLKDAILEAAEAAGFDKLHAMVEEARKRYRETESEADYRALQALRKYRDAGPSGQAEYLRWLAHEHPRTFANLLGRVLPYNLVGKVTHDHKEYTSKEEIMERLKEAGVPIHSISN